MATTNVPDVAADRSFLKGFTSTMSDDDRMKFLAAHATILVIARRNPEVTAIVVLNYGDDMSHAGVEKGADMSLEEIEDFL